MNNSISVIMLLSMVGVAYYFILKGLERERNVESNISIIPMIIGFIVGTALGIFIAANIPFQKFSSGKDESIGMGYLLILISCVIGGISGLLIYIWFRARKYKKRHNYFFRCPEIANYFLISYS